MAGKLMVFFTAIVNTTAAAAARITSSVLSPRASANHMAASAATIAAADATVDAISTADL